MRARMNIAAGLAVIGAVALMVGLSLNWYEPDISAWTAFEVVDLLLAAIAVAVVLVVLGRSPERPQLEAAAGWIPVLAIAALVLVVASILNPPPAAVDRSLEVGAWISLAGAVLLAGAALLATTEVSVVVSMRPRRHDGPTTGEHPPVAAEGSEWDAPGAFDEPVGEPITDENMIEPDHGATEPLDQVVVDDDADDDSETRPLPPERNE